MSGHNSTPNNSDWVRLNVGGKVFQTTKDTLSRCPGSFLARLVNGDLPSEKDESGAYLVDGDPKHFRTILTYLRRGVLIFNENEKTAKELLCEADFYNIEPLVNEIRKFLTPANVHTETIFLFVIHFENNDNNDDNDACEFVFSEKHDDYEVLQSLREKFNEIQKDDGMYWFSKPRISAVTRMEIEGILHNFGFVEKFYDANHQTGNGRSRTRYWKYVRTVSK